MWDFQVMGSYLRIRHFHYAAKIHSATISWSLALIIEDSGVKQNFSAIHESTTFFLYSGFQASLRFCSINGGVNQTQHWMAS